MAHRQEIPDACPGDAGAPGIGEHVPASRFCRWLNDRLGMSVAELATFGLLLAVVHLTSYYGFLLFHSSVELFCVFIAVTVFVIVANTRRYLRNQYLLFVGIGYFFVGMLDLLHALSYKGLGIFTDYDYYAPQFWIVARYLEAATLLLAFHFLGTSHRVNLPVVASGFLAVSGTCVAAILYKIFPVCFVPGEGLTLFKIGSEYVICAMLLAAAVLLHRRRRHFDSRIYRLVSCSIALTIVSELCFTRYFTDSMSDLANQIGHMVKVATFYLIYKAVVVTALRDPVSLLFRDIRQSEETIRRLNEDLERRVEDRTADLIAANRELEAFTYATSHDLRGPLGRINSFSTLLEQRYRDRLEGDGLLFLDFIRQNAVRLTRLVDDLLDHARVAQQSLELHRVDASALARAIVAEKAEEIQRTGAEVRLDIPEGLTVLGDPQVLSQALGNLLDNALKFSDQAEVPSIEIGGEALAGRCRLWLRDNGIGFDMAYRDKIFEMFRRLHTHQEYQGSGVGLALVKRAMERMGGRVWAESTPGLGATFFLELEAAPAG